MGPFGNSVAVLHERLEALDAQLSELQELRMRVLIAEQTTKKIGATSQVAASTPQRRTRSSSPDLGIPLFARM